MKKIDWCPEEGDCNTLVTFLLICSLARCLVIMVMLCGRLEAQSERG